MPAGLVLALFGPTASGKSSVAEAIAERIPAEIVSADSMQAYRGVPVLTNQPPGATHLVAIWSLDHEGSVAEYARLAHAAVDSIRSRNRTPVVVGGTGLYFRAALVELGVPPAPTHGSRERWGRIYDRLGPDRAYAALAERDPAAARALHPNDRRRVIRALELVDAGLSLHPTHGRLWSADTRHPTLIVGVDVPREELLRRIEHRTRRMFEYGVAEEARAALTGELSRTAGRMIGLREAAELPEEAAIEAIVIRTRQYAAYQRRWMRRIPGLVSVRGDRPPREIAAEILNLARSRKRVPTRRAG